MEGYEYKIRLLPFWVKKIALSSWVIAAIMIGLYFIEIRISTFSILKMAHLSFLIGGLLIILSKEKREDERVFELRLRSVFKTFSFIIGSYILLNIEFLSLYKSREQSLDMCLTLSIIFYMLFFYMNRLREF